MRKYFLLLLCLISFKAQAFEHEIQIDNDDVCVAHIIIMPYEEIGWHRDTYPAVVYALQGGIITRLEADGSMTQVHLPTGQAIFRAADPPGELHKSVNNSSTPIEVIAIQLKNR